jgi:hypothetical protein
LEFVRDFKKKRAVVQTCLSQIAELQLVLIERKRVYEEGQFEKCQADHRSAMAKKLQTLASDIKTTLKAMFCIVSLDPVDVQREWDKFVASVDHSLEEALKQSIKRTYHTISRAINGDKSHDVQPIFKVNVLLEKCGSDHNASQKVEFKPSMQALTEMVNSVCKEIIAMISIVSRNRHRSEVAVREEEVEIDPSNERLLADLTRSDAQERERSYYSRQHFQRRRSVANNGVHILWNVFICRQTSKIPHFLGKVQVYMGPGQRSVREAIREESSPSEVDPGRYPKV